MLFLLLSILFWRVANTAVNAMQVQGKTEGDEITLGFKSRPIALLDGSRDDVACGQGRHPGPVYSSRRATNALAGAMWRPAASRNISKSDAQPEMAFSPEIG